MLGFGLVWFMTGLAAVRVGLPALGAAAVVYVAVAAVAALLVRGHREEHAEPSELPTGWRRRFNRIGALQGVAIGIAVALLIVGDVPHLIPPVVGLIVGVHFFPLASTFDLVIYRAAGLGICGVSAVGFFLSSTEQVRAGSAVVGLGAGLILWLTALMLVPGRQLSRDERSERPRN